jgi:hypothetical protein
LREPEAAVFRGDLNAESAKFRERVDYVIRNFAGAIDFVRVNFFAQELFESMQKGVALIAIFRGLRRKRVDPEQVERTHEQSAGEGMFASDFAGSFG